MSIIGRSRLLICLVALPLAGCGGSLELDAVSSLPFDAVACPTLVAQRNAAADQGGVPRDASYPGSLDANPGEIFRGGFFVPDLRGSTQKARAKVIGRVSAMNDSIRRRQCKG